MSLHNPREYGNHEPRALFFSIKNNRMVFSTPRVSQNADPVLNLVVSRSLSFKPGPNITLISIIQVLKLVFMPYIFGCNTH
jgi:hypothetical protein